MKISIITPSYNQANFLETTLLSVLTQKGVELEYIVVDGGSTDGSKEIIKKYSDRLTWWCSEPDAGQYEAINKGFEQSTGDLLAWINSSDIYLPWTLNTIARIFESNADVNWVAANHKLCIGENDEFAGYQKVPGYSRNAFLKGLHGSRENPNFIQQESCFWRRSLWNKIGCKIPDTYRYAADFHLWSLMFEHSPLTALECPLAGFRFHDAQRSKIEGYMDEVEDVLIKLRSSPQTPSHHNTMPVAYLSPPGKEGNGFGEWIVNTINNDNFIFEVNDSETALHQKEVVINGLNALCIQRGSYIHELESQLKKTTSLRYIMGQAFKKLINLKG